jgi:hypothetical protein
MIGTPAMDGRMHARYVESLLLTQIALRQADIELSVRFELQDSLVMSARNSIVAAFRASRATDLMFIDSDISWEPEDLLRLLRYDLPLVAGIYRRKSENVSFAIRFSDPTLLRFDPKTGLLPAKQVGAGFLRLRRDCIERMVEAYQNLHYKPPPVSGETQARYALFDTSIEDQDFVGEDFTFCNRWRSIGGTVWVDADVKLQHLGTKAFVGVLREALARTKPSSTAAELELFQYLQAAASRSDLRSDGQINS